MLKENLLRVQYLVYSIDKLCLPGLFQLEMYPITSFNA